MAHHGYNLRSQRPICPITLQPIRDPVRTLAGVIYERAAIAQWLTEHSSDPVTNLVLPSKDLLPVGDPRQTPSDFRKDLVWTICTPFYHVAMENERKFVCPQLKTVEASQALMDDLRANPMKFYRPIEGLGSLFHGLHLKSGKITDASFKDIDFRGSTFEHVIFLRVTFNHCNLSHTDLRSATFIDCVFRGERTIFVDAKVGPEFHQCFAESHKSWSMASAGEFRESMRARGVTTL